MFSDPETQRERLIIAMKANLESMESDPTFQISLVKATVGLVGVTILLTLSLTLQLIFAALVQVPFTLLKSLFFLPLSAASTWLDVMLCLSWYYNEILKRRSK